MYIGYVYVHKHSNNEHVHYVHKHNLTPPTHVLCMANHYGIMPLSCDYMYQ